MIDWIDPLKLILGFVWYFGALVSCMTGLITGVGALHGSIESDRDTCFKIFVVSVVLLIIWEVVEAFLIYNPIF